MATAVLAFDLVQEEAAGLRSHALLETLLKNLSSAVTLGPGETYLIDVDVHLDFTAAEGDNIRTLIDDQIGPEGGELQLLDAIEVGTPT